MFRALLLLFIAAAAHADSAPEPGSPEAAALAQEEAKTCRPGEAMVVCGVRAGVGWHSLNCDKFENHPGYYLLKSFKYEEAYCRYLPGKSKPKPAVLSAQEPVKSAAGSWLGAFLLTVCVEAAIGIVLGFRSRREFAALAGANLLTHPAFYFLAFGASPTGLWALEFEVFLLEAVFLRICLPSRGWRALLTLSLLMNLGSFLFGAALLW